MNCSPIFFIYLAFLILLLFFKESRIKAIIIYVTFIFLFEAASYGSDYGSYKLSYYSDYSGTAVEALYYYINYAFHHMDVPFGMFRFIWGSIWVGLICYSMYKMNKRYFNLSFIILFLGYPMYTLSAIRQIATMAICFWCMYRMYYKKDYILPVFASYLSAFIHKAGYLVFFWCAASAVAALVIFIISKVRGKKPSLAKLSNAFTWLCKKWLIVIPLLIIIRVGVYYLGNKEPFYSLFLKIVSAFYNGKTLLSFGVLSRGVLLALSMWMYAHVDGKRKTGPIMLFYTLCIAAYIVFPYETFSGRLFNNGRILECALIPMIYGGLKNFDKSERKFLEGYDEKYVLPASKCYLLLCLAIYFVMFMQQMSLPYSYSDGTNAFSFLNF